jgi:hypothetical protein
MIKAWSGMHLFPIWEKYYTGTMKKMYVLLKDGRKRGSVKIIFVILMMTPLSVFALDNSDVYQSTRRVLADDVPVKAIAKISDENVKYFYWHALFSIDRYDVNLEIEGEI